MMKKLKFKKSTVSINGDLYQIQFDEGIEEDYENLDYNAIINSSDPYFLIQCDFEFPSRKSYIESDDLNLIGLYIVNSVQIGRGIFIVKYGPNDKYHVSIEFTATDKEQLELINAAKTMFKNVQMIR